MSSTPDVVASDVDVKILDSILLPYYSWTSSLYLKVYADSPESGAMRAPEDVDVLGVTGDAFKGKSIIFLMSIGLQMMVLMEVGTGCIVMCLAS
jgi:hypothetical protein